MKNNFFYKLQNSPQDNKCNTIINYKTNIQYSIVMFLMKIEIFFRGPYIDLSKTTLTHKKQLQLLKILYTGTCLIKDGKRRSSIKFENCKGGL